MGGASAMMCFNCQQPGHRASECPNMVSGGPRGHTFGMAELGPIGSNFGGVGGMLAGGGGDLGMGGLGGMRGDEDRPCMRCGQKGHRSLECPTRSGGGVRFG